MYPNRIGSLVSLLLTALLVLLPRTDARSQTRPPGDDTDNVVPVAASVQVLRNVELPLGSTKMKVSSIEYAQQGTTVYLLPVWVVARVEALSNTGLGWEQLPPNRGLSAKIESTPPRLRVHLGNLLAQEDTRAAVEKRLREHVATAEGVKPEQVKLRSPTFNPRGYRVMLAAPGTTGEGGEVSLSRPVILPQAVAEDSGRVILELLPENVAGLQAANAEPVLLRDTYLKLSGQMKARFEKQQYLANFQVVQAAITSLQNDLKSFQPTGQSPPEVFVQVPAGGAVEGKAAVVAAFSQHLVGSISVRDGATANPGLLNEMAERVLGRVLSQVELAQAEEAKRVAVMLGNMATLSATVGEIKTLAKQTRAEREKALKVALDEMEARRTGQRSDYSGSVGVRFGLIGGKVEAAYANASEDERATRRKQELETLNRGLDELARHFDGRVPTLTGIRFDQKALDESVKAVQVELQQSSFTTGWSQHDWTGIKLTTTAGLVVSPELLLRQAEEAQARYAEFNQLLGSPEKVKELQELLRDSRKATDEARATAERMAEVARRRTPAGFERQLKNLEFRVRMGSPRTVLQGHTGPVLSLAFSPDGTAMATASSDQTVRLWDAKAGAEKGALKGDTSPVSWVAFSPDGKTVVTRGARPGAISTRFWDSTTGEERTLLKEYSATVSSLAFSPDGRLLATGGTDQTVRLWDVATGAEGATLKGHTGRVSSVAFSPDGKLLATGGNDSTARLWDAATGGERAILKAPTSVAVSVAFSPDGKTVMTRAFGFRAATGAVHLWDAATGVERAVIKVGTGLGSSAVFSPDGKLVATGGSDQTARLWDAATGAERSALKGHTGRVIVVAFSPDGKLLATASDDQTTRLWDAATGDELTVLRGYVNRVPALAFSPDGKTLATGGDNNTVRLWEIP